MKLTFIFCLFIHVFSVWSQTAVQPIGSGTEGDPYQIATAENLYWLSQEAAAWDSHFVQTADIDLSDSKNWNEGKGFTPIGNKDKSFTGTYEGGGFSISSLFISDPDLENNGLFGAVENATLRKIIAQDFVIESNYYPSGGIAATANNATLDSCIVTNTNIDTGVNAGAIVGKAQGCTVTNCSSSGVIRNGEYLGGIIGTSQNTQMTGCNSTVNIDGYYSNITGGLVARNSESCQIVNSFYLGIVNSSGGVTGGITAINYGRIDQCYFNGQAIGRDVGGIVGHNHGEIQNGYTVGNVVQWYDSDFQSPYGAGGVVGVNLGTIENAYDFTQKNLSDDYQTGGFAGRNRKNGEIANCYLGEESYSGKEIGYDEGGQNVGILTFEEMRTPANFEAWNFETIWQMEGDSGFPSLQNTHSTPLIFEMKGIVGISNEYIDTIETVLGDPILFEFTEAPEGMTINGNIISWKPSSITQAPVQIKAVDQLGLYSSFSFSISVHDFAGSGSIEDPFQIETITQLDNVRNLLDKHFILMNDLDFTSVYDDYRGWWPIGNDRNPFTGSFNGNGHVIEGFYSSWIEWHNIGLFGYLDNALIENLGVNVEITGGNRVGILAGTSYQSTISGCYTSGQVLSPQGGLDPTGGYIGGMVGLLIESHISDCYSTAEADALRVVGGLIGGSSSSEIINCYTSGSVTANSSVGGLLGYNDNSTISSSYFNLETTNQSSGIGRNTNDQLVEGLTSDAMKTYSSFQGWDFAGINSDGSEDIWTIDPDMNNGFPVLAWQSDVVLSAPDELQLIAFPNPGKNYITILSPEIGSDLALVELISLSGEIIKSVNNIQLPARLDVSTLSKGIYVIKVSSVTHSTRSVWIKD